MKNSLDVSEKKEEDNGKSGIIVFKGFCRLFDFTGEESSSHHSE